MRQPPAKRKSLKRPPRAERPRLFRSTLLVGSIAAIAVAGLGVWLLHGPSFSKPASPHREAPRAEFVGSKACRSCHAAESDRWSRSHHSAAMAVATDLSVLASVNNPKVAKGGGGEAFYRKDGKFFVHTDGPDGRPGDFVISYTFGVAPLQQYLVALSKGRLQALTTAWDSRSAVAGGQRWFSLYPDVRSSDDELHWTRPAQNWNYMCADCHSTNVRKNYDAAADSFSTTWSEIAVGCEACHGPGSGHLAWAAKRGRSSRDSTMGLTVQLDERHRVTWAANASTGIAVRSRPRTSDRELQVCAQCHSRRRQIAEGYVAGNPYYDHYRPALLTSPLYFADGQQRGEVYEWGSFLQSRMNAHGVTCSDCHEPHSGELRAPGAAVCATCHSPAKYDAPAHQHHQSTAGVTCLSCHMPAATYMKVDPRRDHSFRVPRPDLSVTLGTPNACSSCHADRGPRWEASQITAWRSGDTSAIGFQRFAAAFAAVDAGKADARQLLSEVAGDTTQPPIARATALAELTASDRDAINALSRGLYDPSPLVRLGALQGLTLAEPSQRSLLSTPLLSDSMRVVRIAATQLQAGAAFASSEQQAAFERASREFVAAQQYDADRADARTNLGTFYAELGDLSRAQSELQAAIRLDPFFPPAYVNLADVFRAQQAARDPDAERVLRSGLVRTPASAALHHALGLVLIRLHRLDDARSELQRAAQLDSTNVRFGYAYAVALYSTGKAKASIAVLERLITLDENNRDVLAALASYHREQGDIALAKQYGDRLRALTPGEGRR
jgi:tetratricopeptide (TPR) repeat protein/nitrate/TMAO reductase-like tetraheme cytochrome c subunit